jgi:hypothetical protein
MNARLGPDKIRFFGKGWPPQANAMELGWIAPARRCARGAGSLR